MRLFGPTLSGGVSLPIAYGNGHQTIVACQAPHCSYLELPSGLLVIALLAEPILIKLFFNLGLPKPQELFIKKWPSIRWP